MKNRNIKKCIASLFAEKCIASLLCDPSGNAPAKTTKTGKGKFVKRSFAAPYKKIIFAKRLQVRVTWLYLCNIINGESHKTHFDMYTFKTVTPKADTIRANRKEKKYVGSIVIFEEREGKEPFVIIDMRFYDTDAKTYCCVWHHIGGGQTQSGGGSAGGYGYCKDGSAASEALIRSGVDLVEGDRNFSALDGQDKRTIESRLLEAIRNLNPEKKYFSFIAHA
jgi:hypothetical protein